MGIDRSDEEGTMSHALKETMYTWCSLTSKEELIEFVTSLHELFAVPKDKVDDLLKAINIINKDHPERIIVKLTNIMLRGMGLGGRF